VGAPRPAENDLWTEEDVPGDVCCENLHTWRPGRMLIDARSVEDGAELTADLTIVGSGPAGLSIADRLRSSGLSVCLVEAGADRPDVHTQRLYRGDIAGRSYFALDSCRFRMFGGSSNRWGGWCRPLDPEDFASPAGSSLPGWPIAATDLVPYAADAADLLELPRHHFEVAGWPGGLAEPLALADGEFEHVLVRFSPQTNFAQRYGRRLLSDRRVTVLLNANVTELIMDAGAARLDGLRVRTLTGRTLTVRSRAVVLAAGGIENPRLLLAATATRPAGVGNEHDLVGRCFMEHIHARAGHLRLGDHTEPPAFYRRRVVAGQEIRGLITPTGPARRRHDLLACSFQIEPAVHNAYSTPFLGWPSAVTFRATDAYLRLRRHRPELAARLRATSDRLWYLGMRSRTARDEQRALAASASELGSDPTGLLALYSRAEQIPNLSSRVTLSGRRDALGMPLSRLDWRLSDSDIASVTGWVARLDAAVRQTGQGRVVGPVKGWESQITGGPHHMGTTRMSADPRHGVVDANCRVHSVDNLFIAGSSVFSTGGWANPTFTLVGLALRLADHLRLVLTSDRAAGDVRQRAGSAAG
jgi:choline dehydrogenase-like flavoprotein